MSGVGGRQALKGFGEVIMSLEILKKAENSAASK
jgi:hypothetical protein